MTELTLTTAIPPTALATYLGAASLEPEFPLISYMGAITPAKLDAAEAETDALLSGVGVHDLGWLRRIAIRGEDRFRWLSGMVTNGVESLHSGREFGAGAYNLVLNAQGRIQGDCYVWRDGDKLEIEVAADQYDALLAHFDRFIVMDDVELAPLNGQACLGITGPNANDVLAALRLPSFGGELLSFEGVTCSEADPLASGVSVRLYSQYGTLVPHYALWVAVEEIPALWVALVAARATPVGSESLETLRIAEGIPAYGVDIQSRDLAQETGQERALSFTKGCYLGQEIVERIRSRGQVHRHLRSLELFPDHGYLPAAGTELRFTGSTPEAKAAGTLTSIAHLHRHGTRRIFAIGMVRAEAEIGGRPLTFDGGEARILTTPPKLNDGPTAAEETA